MNPTKLCVAVLLFLVFLAAIRMVQSSPDNPKNRRHFWDRDHLQSTLKKDDLTAKVCYCVRDGKVVCFVHAWMSDDEKKAMDAAPPPSFFLKDFHRPETVGEDDRND